MSHTPHMSTNLISTSWNQIDICEKKYSLKLHLGNLDIIELMLFDIENFELFYLYQNSEEIETQLKVSLLFTN